MPLRLTALPVRAGSAFYLNGVSEHEFGHVTGLCHTNNPSSLMDPSFGACENKSSGADENAGENPLCYALTPASRPGFPTAPCP